jgi:hypothetical protein
VGVFDFLKDNAVKKPVPSRAEAMQSIRAKGKQESRGTIKVDSFTFNVRDYNLRGFIIEPYDKDILAKGQRFKFDMKCSKDAHVMEGRAEAVVTKIANGALAASFTIKPSGA